MSRSQPVSPVHRAHARRMRKAMTEAELRFWNAVRAHRLENLHFRRQYPLHGFIVDFACPEKRIIVEIDGCQHAGDHHAARDIRRDRVLEEAGWTVLRFWNHDVLARCGEVCRHVLVTAGIDAA